MKNLPIEILPQIFELLLQEDQIECMFICRLWKNIIDDSCLFRTLHVFSYPLLEKVSKKIEKQPRLGNNVQRLALHFFDPEETDLSYFLKLFPNLRKLCTYFPFRRQLVDNPPTFPWYNHIESIEEVTTNSIVLHVLSNNVCPNLTVLRFCDHGNDLIPLLKNAPGLKTLILEENDLQFADFNKIHESLPVLETLQFKNVTIRGDEIDRKVIPATSITKLSLFRTNTFGMDTELKLLHFITVKYPNLVELVHETYFTPSNIEEENLMYKNGWDPLLQVLRPQLKKLFTNYLNRPSHFLSVLDKNNCQIHHIRIYFPSIEPFPDLAKSQQVLHLRRLTLGNVPIRSLKWLEQLKALEVLEILRGRYEQPLLLDFNDIINNCPVTLRSLTFHNITLTGDLVGTSQHNVKYLSFTECKIPEKLIRFIDRHFPLLSNLKVKDCFDIPKNIILRSTELESFCYIDTNSRRPTYILTRNIYDGEERLYFIEERNHDYSISVYQKEFNDFAFPPVRSQPSDNIKVEPDIILCCFTVKKVLFYG